MIAVLRYTNCIYDTNLVFNTLAITNVEILQTKLGLSIYPRITIRVANYEELNQLVSALNRHTAYGV